MENCERLAAALYLQSCAAILTLTEREKCVCVMIWLQLPDKQICGTLGMSRPTLRGHVKTLFRKLTVQTRTGIALCYERSLHSTPGKLFPWIIPSRKQPIHKDGMTKKILRVKL